jgi:hypothetical protein
MVNSMMLVDPGSLRVHVEMTLVISSVDVVITVGSEAIVTDEIREMEVVLVTRDRGVDALFLRAVELVQVTHEAWDILPISSMPHEGLPGAQLGTGLVPVMPGACLVEPDLVARMTRVGEDCIASSEGRAIRLTSTSLVLPAMLTECSGPGVITRVPESRETWITVKLLEGLGLGALALLASLLIRDLGSDRRSNLLCGRCSSRDLFGWRVHETSAFRAITIDRCWKPHEPAIPASEVFPTPELSLRHLEEARLR